VGGPKAKMRRALIVAIALLAGASAAGLGKADLDGVAVAYMRDGTGQDSQFGG